MTQNLGQGAAVKIELMSLEFLSKYLQLKRMKAL
jgi:hypothetical protein